MAFPAINTQEYRFNPTGPYDTGLSVKTELTINATGSSSLITQDAAHATTAFTTANAELTCNPNAKAESATRLYVKKVDVSVSGQGYLYIGHVTAVDVGSDPETVTILEAASCTIPVGTRLYSESFAPMLNGRIQDVLAGASASVKAMTVTILRGEVVIVINYAG
tara:strand:- start:2062 stop:2556 length:495 start_codon:yes stop_codon:yes gene_type:complete